MAKNLNVNLTFNAQTGQAKTQIQELQTLLNKIAYAGNTTINVNSGNIREAAAAAKELQYHLNNAYNATTGNFDLSRLDKSLKSAQTNIGALSGKLLQAGQTGQQAFMTLAQSIAKADQPMLRLGTRMQGFMTTLKNTARWQISSSILHGFMGTIQSAYGYAQDLNESLNNIRIVTGQSTEQMAQFADQANKAAKALSTTTTEYTNASLIYYQQGLNDAQVKERTDATIKMANVSRQSAETVSDQMTAIWNNFDDGSKSLEYYGDVITALGAKTASSSQEIAAGLEKFAAVSETIGLSYEYATSALATVTATTRQSADVVGTAFKTIFTRLQGLSLGETLEDGVNLNKYSEALAKVGVNAIDANGNLIEMDNILDQLGERWDDLSKAEQTALAQTVAGVRQYTQLVALMDNWDFFGENLATAYDSEGTLNEQAEIYAESWEAASDRVRAAAESIYGNLLDDDFFIGVNNGFAEMLGGIGEFIQGIGGMKGVIVAISSLILTNFANRIPDAIKELSVSFTYLTKGAGDAYLKLQKDFREVSESLFAKGGRFEGQEATSFGFLVTSSNQLAAARTAAAQATKNMSNAEKMALQTSLDLASTQQDAAYQAKVKVEELTAAYERQKTMMMSTTDEATINSVYNNISASVDKAMANVPNLGKSITPLLSDTYALKDSLEQVGTAFSKQVISKFDELKGKGSFSMDFKSLGEDAVKVTNEINNLKNALQNINKAGAPSFAEIKTNLIGLIESLPPGIREVFKLDNALRSIKGIDPSAPDSVAQLKKVFLDLENTLGKNVEVKLSRIQSLLRGIHDPGNIKELISIFESMGMSAKDAEAKVKELQNNLQGLNFNHTISGVESLTAVAALLGNISMGLRSIQNIFSTLSDPDISGFEKLTSVLMSVSMLIPAVTMGIANITKITASTIGILSKMIPVETALTATITKKTAMQMAYNVMAMKGVQTLTAETSSEIALKIAKESGIAVDKIKLVLDNLINNSKTKRVALSPALVASILTEAGAETTANAARGTAITLQTILNVLTGQYGKLIMAGAIVLIAAVIWGIVKAMDALVVSQKEATENMQELTDKYNETKEELKNLQSELETTKDRIQELQAQDTLTLIEQEELNTLLETNAELERQIALKEKLAASEQKAIADEFEKNADSLDNWLDQNERGQSIEGQYGTLSNTNPIFRGVAIPQLQGTYEQQKRSLDNYFEKGMLDEDEYNEILSVLDNKQSKFLEDSAEAYASYVEGFKSFYEQHKDDPAYQDEIDQYAKKITQMNKIRSAGDYENIYLDSMSSMFEQSEKDVGTDIMGEIFGAADGEIPEAADLANKFSDTFKDQLYKAGILPEDYAQYLIDKAGEIEDGIQKTFTGKDGTVSDTFKQMKEQLSSEDWEILPHLKLTGKETFDEVLAKVEEYKNSEINVDVNTSTKEDFSAIYKTTKGLKQGDSLDPDTYNDLIGRLGDGFEDFFDMTAEGEYQLTAKAEEFQAAVEKIQLENIFSQIKDNNEQIEANNEQARKAGNILSSWGSEETFITSAASIYDGKESYNTAKANAQVAFLDAMGFDTSDYLDDSGNIEYTTEKMGSLAAATQSAMVAYQGLDAANQALVANNAQLEGMLASSAQTLDQLAQYAEVGSEAYNTFFDTVFEREAEAEGFEVDELTAYADTLKDVNAATIESEQEAKRLALAHAKMNRGIQNLTDNWDDWSKALKSDDLTKKSKAIAGLRDVMSDLTGTDMSELPAAFFESAKNAELLEKALQGDVEAINELTAEATKSLIVEMDLDASTTSNLQNLVDQTLNAIDVKDLEVGASLNDTGMYEAFQSLLDSGAVTVDQMNAILSGIGFKPDIQMQRIPIDNAVASADGNYYTVEYVDTEGNTQTKRISSQQYNEASSVGYIEVPVINSKTTSYTGGGGSINKQNKSGGGGGGGSSKPRELTKKSKDNRYHDLNNTLDDISESLKDINRELDAAYGTSRTKSLEKMIDLLKEEKGVLEDKLKANVEYLEDDQALLNARLDEGSRKFGITNTVEIDENNNLDNWESYMNSVYDQLNAYEKQYNELPESEKEKFMTETLEPFEKWLAELEEAGETFEQTAEEQEDIIQELKDIQIEIMEANYDMWENELDKFEEITDDHVHQLERVLEHFSDSFFARAEKMAKMSEITDIYNTGHASTLSSAYDNLNTQYQNGDITIADFIDGMKRIQEMAEQSIDELYDYMDQMTTYYADTVDMSLDIINGVIDQFDHFQSVLDHYANIYEIIQGTVDFDTQLDILNARKDMLMQEGESVRAAYDMYKSERKREEEEFLKAQEAFNAVSDLDPESDEYKAKYYAFMEAKNSYEAALAAEQEMQEQLLANAEEYAQTIREIFTTEVEMFGEQMEKESLKLLDNVHSFDQLNEQIEYAKSLTEDWLTETNKVYETNKLINTAQGALEKTENSLAKNKLSAFIKETEQLQNQSKLSNFELEVQQKKYDLLLAEIALEEARNAKSTVRMQRDSEGNIGYVYTADTDAINNAEQDLADAENDLYNLRLEGANEFAEKRLQAEQDYQDKLKELWTLCYVDHEISEEEYQARLEALSSSHYELMEGYAHIYNEAIRYDTRVTADAWSTEYKDMVLDTESWKEYTSKYLENVSKSYGEYQSNVEWLNNQINTSNDGVARNIRENLNAAIDETTAASKRLGDYTKDELIPALEKELIAVDNVADEFRDNLIPQILAAIKAYQDLADAALASKQAAMEDEQDIEVDIPEADGEVTVDTGDVTGNEGDTGGGDNTTGGGGKTMHPTGTEFGGQVSSNQVWDKKYINGQNYYLFSNTGGYWITLSGATSTKVSGDVTTWGGVFDKYSYYGTGGYTGHWGPEGKMAVLHQKELVLNAEDTDNMLRTVSLVRDIIQRIDIGASTLPMRPGFAINSLGDTGSTLEQRVSIEANFPNVQDRYEIEEAFNNLINTASQFANRKKL